MGISKVASEHSPKIEVHSATSKALINRELSAEDFARHHSIPTEEVRIERLPELDEYIFSAGRYPDVAWAQGPETGDQ